MFASKEVIGHDISTLPDGELHNELQYEYLGPL